MAKDKQTTDDQDQRPTVPLRLAGCDYRLAAKNYTETVQQADLAGIYSMQLMFDLPGKIWFPNKVSRVVAAMPPGYTKTKLVKFDHKESMASLQNQVTLFWYMYTRRQPVPD